MIDFDIIFLDVTCYKPYDTATLDNYPLGGTEASVVRVAEALADRGYKTGVVQHNRTELSMGRNAFFMPMEMLSEVKPQYFITLRGLAGIELFPEACKYSWQHDNPIDIVKGWADKALEHSVEFVAVSQWHADKLADLLNMDVSWIYNPVPDGIYLPEEPDYDHDRLVWTASPHKGLKEALGVFKQLRKRSPKLRLHVFNPGYMNTGAIQQDGVYVEGPKPCVSLWKEVMKSLAVFYPTQFEETFGLIAAEANALHVPIATMPIAGLTETVNNYLCSDNKDLIQTIVGWYNEGRPWVRGKDEFRTSNVVDAWITLLEQREQRSADR